MKTKAQSILEYVVLVGVIAAALTAMQVYFKRGIQAAIKLSADDMNRGMKSDSGYNITGQKKGAADYDYQKEGNKLKGDTYTTATTQGVSTTKRKLQGAVSYGKDETTKQEGILAVGWQY